MATNPDSFEDFSQQELANLKQLAQDVDQTAQETGLSRREVMKGAGLLGAGVLAGGYSAAELVDMLVDEAAADASTSDSDGNVGTPSDRVDLFADGIDGNTASLGSLSTDSATINDATVDNTKIEVGDSNTDATTGDSSQGIAIGNAAQATNNDTIAIGENAVADFEDAILLGRGADVLGGYNVGIGDDVKTANSGVMIGTLAGDDSATEVAIASPPEKGDIAIGRESGATGEGTGAIALGYRSAVNQGSTDNNPSIAIGANARTTGDNSLTIGPGLNTISDGVGRIGYQTVTEAPNGTRINDSEINNSEMTIYLDESNTNIVFRFRDSAGNIQVTTLGY